MTHGKSEKLCNYHFSYCACHMQISVYDVCLYESNFQRFITFPDTFTTGSNIMPQKKSRYFELIRGNVIFCKVFLQGINLLTNNLPSGYHREMQLTKKCFFLQLIRSKIVLHHRKYANHIQVKIIFWKMKSINTFSGGECKTICFNGVSFRDAYVQKLVKVWKSKFWTE